MAGVDPNAGTPAATHQVPSIGGPATIGTGGHTDQGGSVPSYPETPGVGGPDGSGFPAGTTMKDNTPSDDVN